MSLPLRSTLHRYCMPSHEKCGALKEYLCNTLRGSHPHLPSRDPGHRACNESEPFAERQSSARHIETQSVYGPVRFPLLVALATRHHRQKFVRSLPAEEHDSQACELDLPLSRRAAWQTTALRLSSSMLLDGLRCCTR